MEKSIVKCIYCGKPIADSQIKGKAHTREFGVCTEQCKEKMEQYVVKDKKYKLTMFIMIFIGGCGFLISALFGKGVHSMLGAYIGQIVAGIAFLVFPYPILSFETFETTPIKTVNWISRVIGIVFIVWGVFVILLRL